MRHWLFCPAGCMTLWLMLGALGLESVEAQFRRSSLGNASIMLPTPPREFQRALTRAKRAIDEEQYSDAIEALVELLGTPGNEDFFVEGRQDGPRRSLKSAARDLLGDLPKAGIAIYELQYGVEAKQLLEQAVEARDLQKLTDVSRRFFHTEAGYDATYLLGQLYFDQQRPLAAAMTLGRLEHPGSVGRYGPDLPILLAMSWRMAGSIEKATETLRRLRQRSEDLKLVVAGKEVRIFAENVDPIVWLDEVIGSQADRRAAAAEQWTLFRGDAARNSSTNGGMPLAGLQWRVDVCPESVDDEATVHRIWKASLDDNKPAIPALHPLAVGDYVLMRTVDGIYGVDVRTGKRIWPYPWFEPDETTAVTQVSVNNLQVANNQQTQRANDLKRRVWEDLLQGQLSSDGELVFAVYGNAANTVAAQRVFGGAFNRGRYTMPGNQLVALELATQGKIRWLLGGADGDAPELQNAFFLGPPLPLGEELFVIAEIKDEIKLLVLDSGTGNIVWTQQLGHIDAPYPNSSATRRLVGASPSFADGVLVCPTAAGAVVAVDVSTRSLLWGYEYRHKTRFTRNVSVGELKANPKWVDGSASIYKGRVLVTPIRTGSLFCLDLLTGEPVWKQLDREDGVYVAGVQDDVIVVVGTKEVRGVKLDDGQEAWTKRLEIPSGAMPSGRGFISEGDYFLPTTADQIVRFRMSDGAIVEVVDSEYPLGNLICYRDKILSQTPDALYAFSQRERMRELMPKRLLDSPNDPKTLEDNARLLVDDGKYEEAIDQLRRSLALYGADSPRSAGARALLVDTMLTLLRQDFSKSGYRAELEEIIDNPEQRLEFYRISAAGLEDAGNNLEAFKVLLTLSEAEIPESPKFDDTSGLEELSSNHLVRIDVWLRGKISKIWNQATAEDRRQMQQMMVDRLATAKQSTDVEVRARTVELFFDRPETLELLPRIAQDEIAAERLLAAEQWLTFLQAAGDPDMAVSASQQLAKLYRNRLRWDSVYELMKRVETEWPEGENLDAQSGREMAKAELDALLQDADKIRLGPGQLQNWSAGRVERTKKLPEGSSREQFTELLSIDLREADGAWNPDNRIVYDRGTHQVIVLDGNGHVRVSVPVRDPRVRRTLNFYSGHHDFIHAKLSGHLLVVSLGYEVLAINLLDDVEGRPSQRVLWRTNVTSQDAVPAMAQTDPRKVENPWVIEPIVPMDKNRHRVGMLGPVGVSGVCFQRSTELRCVDALTGDVRWARKGLPHGCSVFGDDEFVFVVPPKATSASVFSMADGAERGQRPVPSDDRRWMTLGRSVLTWDGKHGAGDDLTLRLYDVWNQTDTWKLTYSDGSRAHAIDDKELVVMQPDGKLQVLDLGDGRTLLEAELLPEQMLKNVFAIRSRDQYLIITNRSVRKTAGRRGNFGNSRHVSLGPAPNIHGRVYAFDRVTAEPMWPVPAEIAGFKLPLSQAANSPLLLFVRYMNRSFQAEAGGAVRSRSQTELLCLDRRDGRLLTRDDAVLGVLPLQRVEAFPERNQVLVELRGRQGLLLAYTDKPRPPAVPLQSATGRVQPLTADLQINGRDLNRFGVPGGPRLRVNAGGQIRLNGGRLQIQVEMQPNGKGIQVRKTIKDKKDLDALFEPK